MRAAGPSPALVLIAAVGEDGVIGRDGGLPWKLRSDLRQFRAATLDKPVLMGRKTLAAIGKPLDRRTNIVVTRDRSFAAPGVVIAHDLDAALDVARGDALRRGAEEIAVIGGAEIYAQTLPLADRLLITRVHLRPGGDARFPAIDPALWREASRRDFAAGAGDDAAFTVIDYARAG